MTKSGNEPGVITDLHDFLKWYMQTTLRFPKAHRVTLGGGKFEEQASGHDLGHRSSRSDNDDQQTIRGKNG